MLGSRCCGRHAVASCCLRRCLCSQAVSNCHQLSLVTNPHCLPQVSLASQQLCNSSAGSAVSSQACTSADVEGFTAGYKSMCQFLSLPLLQLPQVAKYDVIMRLDSDSFIHGALLACVGFVVVLILVATFFYCFNTCCNGFRRRAQRPFPGLCLPPMLIRLHGYWVRAPSHVAGAVSSCRRFHEPRVKAGAALVSAPIYGKRNRGRVQRGLFLQ